MEKNPKNQDITVRGGLVNVPLPDTPPRPPRHQPNTPQTKKHTKTKSDHQPVAAAQTTPAKATPPAKPPAADKPAAPITTDPAPGQEDPPADSAE